ncbi:transglycosylase SLT domain-containing protein [Chloroflexota bacterium]|nr:transglycosylase SLT domain-containing protein [Chloroflexota bacterium]
MPSEVLLAPTQTALAEASSQQSIQKAAEEQTGCTLSSGFPADVRQWCPQIEAAAQEVGLPAALIASVIVQESGGDPAAYSSSGAVGLMQVMPRDGLAAEFMCVNGPCFAYRPTTTELKDPAYNIQFGSQYLASLVEKYGSYREALYKYGPMDIGYYYADLVLDIWGTY